jgi:hypothetical protein
MDEKAHSIRRGHGAKALLENQVLTEALEDLLETSFANFLATDNVDYDARESIWAIGQAVMLVRSKLEAYVSDGKLTQENMNFDESQEKQ